MSLLQRIKNCFKRAINEQVERLQPCIMSVSSKDGEDLTEWEKSKLGGFDNPQCPDCGNHLLAGPCGGMSQNFKCSSCNAKFNLSAWEGTWAFCERISDRQI